MRQALHIFKKDARHLRWEIALVLALTVISASSDFAAIKSIEVPQNPLPKVLLALSWLSLIAHVIHTEALPGNKQFWLTRPYSRKSLLAAKMLFLLAFITLPMTISDSAIVWVTGFSPAEHLSGLLWEQVLRWMVLAGPAMAVAAITTGVAELAGSLLLSLAIIRALTLHPASDWGILDWLHYSIAAGFAFAGAAAIVILQYGWRKTAAARIAAVALVGLG